MVRGRYKTIVKIAIKGEINRMAGEDQVKKFFSSILPRKKQPGESKGLQKVQ